MNGAGGNGGGRDKDHKLSSNNEARNKITGTQSGISKTNGLVNGTGRTNGIAGTTAKKNSAAKDEGKTNGLVNGVKKARQGMTNGLTNGNGFTNGLGSKRFKKDTKRYRRRLLLVPSLAAMLLIIPLLVPSELFHPPLTLDADGTFKEWSSTVALTRNLSLDTSIDLIRAGIMEELGRIGFYFEVAGNIFFGDPSGLGSDLFQVFIDKDYNASTGYTMEGIGAEYLVEVFGLNHTLMQAKMYEWSGGLAADEMDWSNWAEWRPATAALGHGLDSGKMELIVDVQSTDSDDAASIAKGRALFRSQSFRGEEDYSDFCLSSELQSLEVIQTSVAPEIAPLGNVALLEVRMRTPGAAVSVQGLKVRVQGSAISGDLAALQVLDASDNLLGSHTYQGGPGEILFESPLLIGQQWVEIRVEAIVVRTVSRTVGLRLVSADSVFAPGAAVSLYEGIAVRQRAYMGLVAPGYAIDGSFSEWSAALSDSAGEQQTGGNRAIDIARYDSHKEGGSVYFYASVRSQILRGTAAPLIFPVPAHAPQARDSDGDSVPDNYEVQFNDILQFDFNNDNVSDAATARDVDDDGIKDYPFGQDRWLNTTIPLWYGSPYGGKRVSIYIGPVVTPPAIGEDTLRVFLDMDEIPNSGYSVGGTRADYLVEITGKNGIVLDQRCLRFSGFAPWAWSWAEVGRPSIAFGGAEIEAEAAFPGLSATGNVTMVFDFRDWRGGSDSAQSLTRGTRGVVVDGRTMGLAEEVGTYVDEAGNVRTADLDLQNTGGNFAYAVERNGVASYFGGRSDGRDLMLLRRGDLAFSWQPMSLDSVTDGGHAESVSSKTVEAVASGSSLTYNGIFPGVNDAYEVRLNMVKHDLTFESPPPFSTTGGFLSMKGRVRLSEGSVFAVNGRQVSESVVTSDDLQVFSPSGVVLTVKAPFAYEGGDVESRADGRFVLEESGGEWLLSMQVPMTWFLDRGRMYPVVLDPTAIIETYGLYVPTSLHHQRKVIYDGSNFWGFYADGSTTVYEHSSDGMSWIESKAQAFQSFSIENSSVWYHVNGSNKIVYIVGDNGSAATQVYVRNGTISGTTITWGTERLVTVSTQSTYGLPAFMCRAQDGRFWIVAPTKEASGQYNLVAVNSTAADDISTWNAPTKLLASDISSQKVFGTVLPLAGGNVYALWYADGSVAGRLYDPDIGWGSVEDIGTATSSVDYGTPSAVTDNLGFVNMVYVAANGSVIYRQRTSSWGSPTILDSSSGNQYATISRQNVSGDLYSFWKNSSAQINASRFSGGSWSRVPLETDKMSKSHVTSVYNVSATSRICWAWSEVSSIPQRYMRFSMMSTDTKSVTVDTGGINSTRNSNQRKIFWDGSYYWAFYVSGGYPVYTYSPDGETWTYGYSKLFNTLRSVSPSIWYYSSGSNKIVYAVADNDEADTNVTVKRGEIAGSTISWGPEYNVTISGASLTAKIAYVCRDSSGYIWIGSSEKETNYNFAVARSSNVDDVSAWDAYTPMMAFDVTSSLVYGVVVPFAAGGVYALWYANGTIAGRPYSSGSWGSVEDINSTSAQAYKIGPSVVVDSSDNVNLLFVNDTGRIIYRQRTSSWDLARVVTNATGNAYPSLTLDTSTGDFYAFWINSSLQIAAKKYSGGSWSWLSGIEVSTTQKYFITTPYIVVDAGRIAWVWTHYGSGAEVKFARIPEFTDFLTPVLVMVLVGLLVRRRRPRRVH